MTDVDGAHNLSIFSSLVWSQQKGCPQKGSKGSRLRLETENMHVLLKLIVTRATYTACIGTLTLANVSITLKPHMTIFFAGKVLR
jgi:hypothetical protein